MVLLYSPISSLRACVHMHMSIHMDICIEAHIARPEMLWKRFIVGGI